MAVSHTKSPFRWTRKANQTNPNYNNIPFKVVANSIVQMSFFYPKKILTIIKSINSCNNNKSKQKRLTVNPAQAGSQGKGNKEITNIRQLIVTYLITTKCWRSVQKVNYSKKTFTIKHQIVILPSWNGLDCFKNAITLIKIWILVRKSRTSSSIFTKAFTSLRSATGMKKWFNSLG